MSISFVSPLTVRSKAGWFYAGLVSSFPDISDSGGTRLSELLPCKNTLNPGCKVFRVSRQNPSVAAEVALEEAEEPVNGDSDETDLASRESGLQDQVLIFQYKNKFHAVANQCPHAAYPLSSGTPFDIEDFGLALSAGLTCSKHGWAFDLYTGRGDRGNYKLSVWEVEIRPVRQEIEEVTSNQHGGIGADDSEIWVRKRQRIG